MKRFKNILYLLDEESLKRPAGADRVAGLARINDARVRVMVADETTLLDELGLKISGRYEAVREEIQKQNSEKLDQFLAAERWQDIAVQADYDSNGNFISIIQKVLRENHDLVITGSSLEKGIDQLAMRLVRKCPCPVWVLKYGAKDFKRILAAVDVGDDYPETPALNKKIIELTHSLAQREGGEAHYLHSWRLEYELMLRGPRFNISPEEIFSIKNELVEERRSSLLGLFKGNHIDFQEHQVHLWEGTSNDMIQKAIAELDIDVVVMGSVARSGIPGLLIGNKAEKLLSAITCTVLTVKPDGFKSPVSLN
jgi:nucleotide-binding universal stress UspA family protein